jgi:surface protein
MQLGLQLTFDTGIYSPSLFGLADNLAMRVLTTTDNETFTIPTQDDGAFDAKVNWGDGTTSDITAFNDSALTHTYDTAGTHSVTIAGTFPNIHFNNGGDKLKVTSVSSLGKLGWTDLQGAFFGCSNMTSFKAGNTDTSAITGLVNAFNGCSGLTSMDLSNFDTSNVNNFGGTFRDCNSLITLDLSNFNTSNVTSAALMFAECTGLTSLNVSSFDTSNFANMGAMFRTCSSLTTLDLSNFDTSSASSFSSMFSNCNSMTDIPGVENFNIESLNSTNDLVNFAAGVTLSPARYDALLINWDAQNPFDGMSPDFGNSTYTGGGTAAAARANLISTDGWTITDGGTA